MRNITAARMTLAATAALALAACSGPKAPPPETAPETTPTPVAVAPSPAPLPVAPVRPAGAEAIDTALAEAKTFNAKALADLAAIEKAEKRIRDQAVRALDAARRGDAGRVNAARSEAETAHRDLADSLSAFRTQAATQQAAVAAALATCGPPPPAAGAIPGPVTPPPPPVTTPLPGAPGTAAPMVGASPYEGCLALTVEQTLLTQNIEAVSARYQAAEAAFRQDRPRLEEAAATVALGKLAPL